MNVREQMEVIDGFIASSFVPFLGSNSILPNLVLAYLQGWNDLLHCKFSKRGEVI
jgi:hypothetical protein